MSNEVIRSKPRYGGSKYHLLRDTTYPLYDLTLCGRVNPRKIALAESSGKYITDLPNFSRLEASQICSNCLRAESTQTAQ